MELGKSPHELLLVSGIGQASKLPHYLKCNTFNGLHGRMIPAAVGAKIANKELTVIAVGGDGDCYGEGTNHFIHNIRRNVDITLLLHNNQVYGLTKGQASPTSDLGFKTKVQVRGVEIPPLNPLALAIALDCSFVARGFAGEREHLSHLIVEAARHRGFALVDILQPCVIWNKVNTFKWYRDRVYQLGEGYDSGQRIPAFEKALEWGERIPLGIIYKNERPTFDEINPIMQGEPLWRRKTAKTAFKELYPI
ncbi:2-oxoglutarate/2-oxoacid ferredoxin oxidoreductase subunit beta [Candidatus Hakubella thermalkaliphila]|uniref:2-oxoglutarate/2-oxoacid ferredoxin oxidoreductase subunit beta n=1 Tax=Candidatus Hakubella thermalkaliphila TaxID=2754717 RepID=A0A6V8PGL7_9ACTN|nr:2-oxoglutarate/2-oxoacid ferredoxin oxidoreductase subunit beta [Candidatus Hakubella thermalkaliphila]GFP37440.1 2-oxoglutarate/2-oxoacid ferredoxin oxidoreductase subunit beta [Candidatus Hakubella thermalkaliphila]GFP39937.1 2-oxoglutarate/2-oxoacid ferredoxin oxidoreductase subunit beta [Candidatus Hakubella thermalkaliphila]GFP43823.1 2-oxoglutarate/2-oxoacid ferredoxin oxidoreductase subunit beta [Candidatus Hakubella thermalkaliphila]